MTGSSSTHPARDDSYLSTRDFDYGVHDEARHTLQKLRGEIAARIRRAAYSDPNATRQDRNTYELAARIAETAQIPPTNA
jgi:hypothetical protein